MRCGTIIYHFAWWGSSLATLEYSYHCRCSVAQSSYSLGPHGLQGASILCLSLSPRFCSNSCPLSRWHHPAISFSDIRFSSCLQSFPESGSFPMSQLFTSSSQKYWRFSFNISLSNECSELISFRVDSFHLLVVQGTLKSLLQHQSWKHQFFGTWPSLWSNSHIHTWLLKKP